MSTDRATDLRARLAAAWARSDQIFDLIDPADRFARPIALRHPVVFYLGHLPAFTWNQVGRGALSRGPMDPHLDALFERGIDPSDAAEAAAQSIDAWPELDAIVAYRDRIRAHVDALVEPLLHRHSEGHPLLHHARVLHVAVEHEQMHHETLLYMLQRCPEILQRPPGGLLASSRGHTPPSFAPVAIPRGPVAVGVDPGELPFHWDNEAPRRTHIVPAFTLDALPVTHAQLAEFVQAGGYTDDRWWTGRWRPARPTCWVGPSDAPRVRWLFGTADFEDARHWPAQVSLTEARAYAGWAGGRLPTEPELNRAAYTGPDGLERAYPWGSAAPTADRTTADFHTWSPRPVGQTPAGASAWGVHELVGNGWEWTDTEWAACPGFVAELPTYPGYSADFFDGDHFVVFGGSWATAAGLLRRSFRNWYQPRYPHVFSSFRVVRA